MKIAAVIGPLVMSYPPKLDSSRCPKCGVEIGPKVIRLGRNFECPNCDASLQVKPVYDRVVRVLACLFGCAAAYGSGLRGVAIAVVGMFYGLFFLLLFEMLMKRLFPPRLQDGEEAVQTLGINPK